MEEIKKLLSRITLELCGKRFWIEAHQDKIYANEKGARVYLQVTYVAPCTKTGTNEIWSGRKWYLSEYCTDDEIVKTAYCAFEAAVKHEIMEGFKVDGIILFNSHVNFEELLSISHLEVQREPMN